MANIEFHHVLPEAVYNQFKTFIDRITGGNFKLDAAYNLVPLAKTAEGANGSGSAMHSGSHPGLNNAWIALLASLDANDALTDTEKLGFFEGFHSVFRTGLDLHGSQPDKLNVLLARLDPAAIELWDHVPSAEELLELPPISTGHSA